MAKYESVSEIKRDFGLETDDINELKKSLKELVKDIHPDKNNGQFKNKLDELNYQKILSALEYLDQGFEIVPKSQLTALMTILKDGLPTKKEESQIKTLDEKIDKIIKSYHDSNLTPKISSTIIAAILTFLWLFPTTVKDHPVLSKWLSPASIAFSIIWAYSLLLTGMYWLSIKRREQRLKEAHKKLNLESIQNRLSESFIRLKSYIEKKENATHITFSKDDLIEHLTDLNIFSLEYEPQRRLRKPNPFDVIGLLVLWQRNIELELAQTLADITIERAKKKNLIQLEQDQNLSDTYSYKLGK